MERRPHVYVPNKAGHDYSDASTYGDLVFLTEGTIERYSTNNMYRIFVDKTKDAVASDFIIISSLSILNAIVSGIFAYRFGQVNYLLFNGDHYVKRTVKFDALVHKEEGEVEDVEEDNSAGDSS